MASHITVEDFKKKVYDIDNIESADDLKLIGLSKQKINYIFLLAKNWPETTKELKNIELLTDDDIGNKLMKHKGIGQWTLDMFLIFSLMREDVFPSGDLAIQKGF